MMYNRRIICDWESNDIIIHDLMISSHDTEFMIRLFFFNDIFWAKRENGGKNVITTKKKKKVNK